MSHISKRVKAVVVSLTIISLIVMHGCSAFQPKTQAVIISTPQPGAEIEVNGRPVGKSPVTVELARNKPHAIVARYTGKSGTANIGTKILGTGVLDIIGTFFFLIPGIGIFTPGFYDLDNTNVAVPLH